jgi:hypothetical protein
VIVDIPAERSAPGRVHQHRYGTLTVPDDDAGRACAGSARISGVARIVPPGVSITSASTGVRTHRLTAWPGTWASHAATVAPIAPGPMMAMLVTMLRLSIRRADGAFRCQMP